MKKRMMFTGALIVGLAGCRAHVVDSPYNDHAALSAGVPYPILTWRPMTTEVDHTKQEATTLFGNDAAVTAAGSLATAPQGAAVALVTWKQHEDEHWFGGRIPDKPLRVEVVEIGPRSPLYRKFEGDPMQQVSSSNSDARAAEILQMKMVSLP